jgi:hypothetical protein
VREIGRVDGLDPGRDLKAASAADHQQSSGSRLLDGSEE